MTVKELLAGLRTALTPAVGDGEARAMAEIIVEDTTGLSRTKIVVNPDYVLTPESVERIESVRDKVLAGEPVQYALGQAQFRGRTFAVEPGVLIPRPETAQLVDIIIDEADGRSDLRVLDVGCGSGCIACSLARDLRYARVTALDINATAVRMTRTNASALGVKVDVLQADVLDYRTSFPGSDDYDIVVSNPPYVLDSEKCAMDARVVDYEPQGALFVPDDDPLLFYRTIAKKAWTRLSRGGRIYFEINPLCAGRLVALMFDIGYIDVEITRDYRGEQRFLTCTRR
ncbi:MAG: peptide chain release factor N(5)-glutamine methyltransferase [Muribaculaceae bacterium]